MGAPEVRASLSWLSSERQVSVSTHRQALSAMLFLYPHVFGQSLPWMAKLERPQRKPRLPVVLTGDEVRRVLAPMDGTHAVLARLLYGTGLRITEALPSRVKDAQG
jgi:integrase